MKEITYPGPLFVAGMPRSGTKLLRDLLNQHSQISIPEVETHFIPLFIKKYGQNFDTIDRQQLLDDFMRTSFYWNMQQLGVTITEVFTSKMLAIHTWEEFVFVVFSYFGPRQQQGILYGDKTPGYITHIPLLKTICPGAKFIHIVRDPRDFCVSVRNIWNKHIYRAAYVWNTTLKTTDSFKEMYAGDYIEIKYEDLISDVEATMKTVCSFLHKDFEPAMCTLSKTAENYGDAKGKTEIVKDNMQKFLKKLSEAEIEQIEALAFDEMNRMQYKPLFAAHSRRPGKLDMVWWKWFDAYHSVKFHIKEKGLMNGVLYFTKLHNQSSWR